MVQDPTVYIIYGGGNGEVVGGEQLRSAAGDLDAHSRGVGKQIGSARGTPSRGSAGACFRTGAIQSRWIQHEMDDD